ncbi:MAG: SDR family oxidoreductase [Burkholderiales bacterium]|nr:SDR family oxidoreductase [Burkholderiales bacterium]
MNLPVNLPVAQDLTGRVALVTGANTGIGRITARELARRGADVFLATRSLARTQPALDEIARLTGRPCAHWIELDLADFASVRACAERFLVTGRPLHLLVNNAGLGGQRGLSRDGLELTFGVNHMGHFLLTRLLRERLVESAPARVVTVASRAHQWAPGLDWDELRRPTRSLTGIREYMVSKLANVLFSAELGRQLAGSGVSSYAVHPGVVDTEIWRQVPRLLRPLLKLRGLRDPEQGAQTTLYCALQAPQQETGRYYADSALKSPSKLAQDQRLAAELWRFSEQILS